MSVPLRSFSQPQGAAHGWDMYLHLGQVTQTLTSLLSPAPSLYRLTWKIMGDHLLVPLTGQS